jgi:hypothetical protein
MFLIDDLILAPLHGVLWVAREVQQAAQQGLADEGEAITTELSQLYMMLETGKIAETEFNAREKKLLDRLDRLPERRTFISA